MNPVAYLLAAGLTLAAATLPAQPHYISLGSETLAIHAFPYTIDTVIDGRANAGPIGTVQRGMENRRVAAQLEGGVAPALTALFRRAQPGTARGTGLWVRVNKLHIYEVTTATYEECRVELSLSFLAQTDSGWVEKGTFGTTEDRRGLDVTKKHGRNIADAVTSCVQTFADRERRGLTRPRRIADDALTTLTAPDHAIRRAITLPVGIYRTFQDFLDNTATTDGVPTYTVEYKTSKFDSNFVRARPQWGLAPGAKYPEYVSQLPEPKPIWGLSDGQHVYMQVDKDYYRLLRKGDEFYLYGYKPDDGMGGALLGGALFGVAGALIGAAIDASTGEEVIPFDLDLLTGALIPEGLERRREKAALLLFCSEHNPDDTRLAVTVNGETHPSLGPKTYLRVDAAPSENSTVAVCLTDAQGRQYCQDLPVVPGKTNVILCRQRKDGLALDQPVGETRAKILERVKSGRVPNAGQ